MSRPLLPCACRRSFGTASDRFFCTHPNLIVADNLVTAEMCRVCPQSATIPPDTFLAYPFSTDGTKTRPEVELIVAHYEEDLSWLEDYASLKTRVYGKGSDDGDQRLPNVGREAHTYLHHIVEHYDDLAEVTVFLQGNPSEHVAGLFEKVCSLDTDTPFIYLGDDILVEDGRGVPPQPGLPLKEFYEELFNATAPEYFSCRAGACFAVSRTTIRSRPREFYQHALKLVLAVELGAWAIERLWHVIFASPPRTEGIVTAADAGFFRDLQFMVRSLAVVSDRPLCVVDIGLTDLQRTWCIERKNVILWTPPQIYEPMRRIYGQFWWQAWIKPFYLLHAPFDRMLWIDADCVALKPLDGLFEQIGQHPVFVRDNTEVVTENDPRLYDELPLPEGTQTSGINLNSGVVGLCRRRDHNILNAWAWAVQWIAMRPAMQRLSAWADQGLLLWAVHKNRAAEHIQQSLVANRPVFEEADLLSATFHSQHSLLEELKTRFPDDTIVHFLGPNKLSSQLDRQFDAIFTGDTQSSVKG